MNAQDRYWQELADLRRDCFYVDDLLRRYQRTDRNLNIFLAITSSTAIAGWAIWQTVLMVWAVLIAGAQVVTVIKPWIPYSDRLKALFKAGPELAALAIAAEREWFAVADGDFTEAEIHEKYITLKSDKERVLRSAMGETVIPPDEAAVARADAAAIAYFARRYA